MNVNGYTIWLTRMFQEALDIAKSASLIIMTVNFRILVFRKLREYLLSAAWCFRHDERCPLKIVISSCHSLALA